MAYKILFTDLDNTLLTGRINGKEITPACKLAAEKALAAGKHIIISSGRGWKSLAYYENLLGIDKPGCCGSAFNGGYVYEYPVGGGSERKVLKTHALTREQGLEVSTELKKLGANIVVYDGEGDLYAERRTDENELYSVVSGIPIHFVDSFAEIKTDFQKIIAQGEFKELQTLRDKMVPSFGTDVYIVFSCPVLLEFGSPAAHKGNAVEFLADYLHTPLSEVIAIGDEGNDITMLQTAGLGIAVANATEDAKAAAKIVSPYNNNEDVFARVVEEYLL